VIPIQIPPLRERSDDIPLMMKHFLGIYNEKFEKKIDGFDQKAYDLFLNYHWPGNVRELENLIERAVALEKGGTIGIQSLPREMIYSYTDEEKNQGDLVDMIQDESFNYSEYVDDISRNILEKSLEINQFNIKKTAKMLKLPYRSLRHLMEKYNLKK
jgi:DNA-binding NtrC family response regulator